MRRAQLGGGLAGAEQRDPARPGSEGQLRREGAEKCQVRDPGGHKAGANAPCVADGAASAPRDTKRWHIALPRRKGAPRTPEPAPRGNRRGQRDLYGGEDEVTMKGQREHFEGKIFEIRFFEIL